MSKASVQYLLKKYGLIPDERSSQNFLIAEDVIEETLRAADVRPTDRILEIGPGVATLTARLCAAGMRVVAVEEDRRFTGLLNDLAAVNANLRIVFGDALRVPFEEISSQLGLDGETPQYKITANLPYHITSRLLARVLSYSVLPVSIVVMVQKEVAERIVAQPGEHSKLSLSVQYYGDPDIVRIVDRKNFYPSPKVDSALLRIRNLHRWSQSAPEKRVWQLIAFGFASKRKKLVNTIAAGLAQDKQAVSQALEKAGIDPSKRPQDLSLSDWPRLAAVLA